ncbi:hypothetical protein Bca52824_071784 [Brassica carinata]|uniref:Uncharacterized protein n=1 Tax=Brassica carinata TaxID=52824 RepID=A0A8X7U3D1_BRACI|nr:hypothetical protein Bca52824_071784 [Brassica carinata]
MILIDEQGTVIQGFIPPSRIDTYLPHMIAGSLYRLIKFYGSKSKTMYRVSEQDVTISFSWNSVLSVLENCPVQFLEDRFRFYGYEEFESACDLKGDLYDYIGHIKLVNEQALGDGLVLDEVEIVSSRRILVHVQTHDGPVMKLYLWDTAATDFCLKFKAQENTPSVILVTTVNPKRFGGTLTISSLSSSRVFLDLDVQPTKDYLAWLGSNSEAANRINADIVTKAETVTIGELFTYIKQEGAKANESVGDDAVVPVPQALIDTIGQTRKFVVKVSKHNLEGKTQALTVTKVLPLEVPVLEDVLDENVAEEPADGRDDAAGVTVKRSSDGIESGETKRAKCG